MKIVFKLYATLQDYLPAEAKRTNALTLELAPGTTIQQIIERFGLPQKLCHLVLIDGNFVPPAARATLALKEGETLAIWPPVAGG
ncbi:MAG: molybdopterin synthase sulfur carrier subunit [Rhodocyclales bacterium RIFCSPLOWO2_02_FULL_63_24]|nr:MAG: molybdopterin synthase sulfur carrier subunit [Rhodocyclales bacterium GWA2_65_19]OHC67152.1 MAG: molybdopterin synthase sulfur carrier subunit [Rhodocyclales bacterium RIFCSPLOWO2_02_FULL_63_24]